MPMRTRVATGLADIAPAAWNALVPADALFARHEFLAAIERSGSLGRERGWEPRHVLVESSEGGLLGAMPLYLKWHSRGEFVFDFSWAQAWRHHGLDYYPKLVSCTPFTPATGPHLLVHPQTAAGPVRAALLAGARALAAELDVSSLHLLFVTDAERGLLEDAGFMPRTDCQFHWSDMGWRDFDDYLGSFTAEKRKKARRERRRVAEQGIRFETLDGEALLDGRLDTVLGFYADTFLRHGHAPYLNRRFFTEFARACPARIMAKLALQGHEPVGAAIFFQSDTTLYGRYWGAAEAFHSLHFETCYYQGIEHCLAHGLGRFEPGTQGEHKLTRGFRPTRTWSLHEIREPRFARAIARYLAAERAEVENYIAAASRHVPYRHPDPARTLHETPDLAP
jgi:predicted N-acyltransferase